MYSSFIMHIYSGLLNGKELELWEELKAEAGKLCLPPRVTADNDHIQKLTEAVADLIKKTKPASKASGADNLCRSFTGRPPSLNRPIAGL